jgi:hypothetical protein
MTKSQSKKNFRKEIKQPDEFVVQSNRALDWAQNNPDKIKLGLGIFVVVLVVIATVGTWRESRNQDAISNFYAAAEIYRGQKWEPALADFQTLAADYDGTTYGKLANLYAGSSALHLEKFDESVKYYQAYLSDSIDSDAVNQVARLNLAAAMTGAGKGAAARTELQKAAAVAGPASPQVQLALARNFQAAGDDKGALDAYNSYLETAPRGAAIAAVQAAVIELGGSLPEPKTPKFPGNITVTQQ